MKISFSLNIVTRTASKLSKLNEPVTIHDSRFIAQMMDRALPHTSSHATIEADLAYPPRRKSWIRKLFLDKKI